MKFSQKLIEKARTAGNPEELIALAKDIDIALTEEEANKYFAKLHREGALADEELDNVSGGCGDDPHEDSGYYTKMKCSCCGDEEDWNGNYFDGVAYECPSCHAIAFGGYGLVKR